MKNASSNLVTLLGDTRDLVMADLWSFTLKNGTTLNYTDWDADLTISATTYKSHDVLITGGKIKQTRGLEDNETDITLYPNLGAPQGSPSLVGEIPFLQACVFGLFDRATAQRQRVFCPGPITSANPQSFATYGPVRVFLGEIDEVDITRNTAIFKCKDATHLLNIYMPRRQFQPTCSWTFGDTNCTFDVASLAVNATAGAGTTSTMILASSLTQAAGYFNYGTVEFTSGLNTGVSRSVKNFSSGVVQLNGPFPQAIATGDAFTITPGCSKNYATNSQQFNGSVQNGSTPLLILSGNGSPPGTYNGYTITFTSGILDGDSAVIGAWQPNAATMATFFPTEPAVGDTFNIVSPAGTVVDSGTVTTPLTASVIPCGLNNANGFFNGGTLLFTSGSNVGQSQTISTWINGIATMATGFSNVPVLGDELTITSSTSANGGTCTGYANTANFGGEPFVPIPETAY